MALYKISFISNNTHNSDCEYLEKPAKQPVELRNISTIECGQHVQNVDKVCGKSDILLNVDNVDINVDKEEYEKSLLQ